MNHHQTCNLKQTGRVEPRCAGTATITKGGDLVITVSQHSHWTVIDVGGELDTAAASSALRRLLNDLIDQDVGDIALDISGLEFIDSMAIGVLVGALRRTKRKGGTLAAVAIPPAISRIFTMGGVSPLLAVYPSVEALPSKPCRP
jgi:anti-anti-sigma factor